MTPTLRVCLEKLVNAVAGSITAFEPELRQSIGNTNLAVIQHRLDEAQAALSAPAQSTGVSREWLDSEEFYDLMQAYRHAPMTGQADVCTKFEAVKVAILNCSHASPPPEDRVREALEKCADVLAKHDGCSRYGPTTASAIEQARAALAGKGGE